MVFACFVLAFALAPVVPRGAPSVSGPSVSGTGGDAQVDPAAHRREVEGWQKARDVRLRSDTGWLTLAALYWLRPGANRFGTAADSELVLPASSAAPAHAGTLHLDGAQVTVDVAPGVAVALAGQPVARRVLKSDAGGAEPDILSLGSLTLQIIERQGRLAVRVKDRNSEVRRAFKGLAHFPVDSRFRVVARFTPHVPPRSISVPNILGSDEALPSPGTVSFDLGGKSHHLDPVIEAPGDTHLFFIFRDQTSGRSTYGAGRFLYADLPADLLKPGTIILDFNKAYSPPCAFTPYATCPLPPPQNRLAIPVEAGEKFDPRAPHPGAPAPGQ